MRPRTIDELFGQQHIVGPGRLLRRAISADQLSSLIFYGPPGTGKTTLARIIANTTRASFVSLNAVLAGVKDIRTSIASAKEARGQRGQRTILFVDEVHRFNKAQQDALLPWVENGTVILIGATTENPYFEVNKALVSRSRVFQLRPLDAEDLRQVIHAALADDDRGFGERPVRIEPEAEDHLVNIANGDARALLNALELAVDTTEPDDDGDIVVTLQVAEESIQRRAVLYDKEGDAHFDAISAFIKSCRGSDPDAALYWLARMIYAGEDPKFVFRRMLILASEDVGMADPDVLGRVEACARAFDRVGLPEGRFHLSQAALVLATAPKSNTTMAFFDALNAVAKEREGEVPDHLKDGNRDKHSFGHGEGYQYPHAFRDHWVAQQYLPAELRGQVFYRPSSSGFEATIADDVARRREAQLEAAETEPASPGGLTYGPVDRGVQRWLARARNAAGHRLGELRDRIFERADVKRHHVVLDLSGGTGLLTWEALRKAPEGGVYTRVTPGDRRIEERSTTLPELGRPIPVASQIDSIIEAMTDQHPDTRFDRVVGYNALSAVTDKAAVIRGLLELLEANGRVVLAEAIPRASQRMWEITPTDDLGDLEHDWKRAEEAIHDADPARGWTPESLSTCLADISMEIEEVDDAFDLEITEALLDRWWRGAYRRALAASLEEGALDTLERWARRRWTGRTVRWRSRVAVITARPADGGPSA